MNLKPYKPFLLLASFALCASSATSPDPYGDAVRHISAGRAFETVERLSSEQYGGRLTGTPGFDAAASWVAGELKASGLRPPADCPGYLQRFPITLRTVERAKMELMPPEGSKEGPKELAFYRDFMPMLQSGSGDITAEVVFAGYGISAPDLGRDDYAGLEVSGKIAMVLRGEPKGGKDWSKHNATHMRIANAKEHGAAGFLLIDSPVLSANGKNPDGLPTAMISSDLADQLLSDSKIKVDELKRLLEKGGAASFPTGARLHLLVEAKKPVPAEGANVLALLKGSDPSLSQEYLIIGAHLDHLGQWPQLSPGANDNASGSAAVLEMALASSRLKRHPRRSILFAWFGGEEMGLLGSEHLSKNPPKGLGRCVAVYNLDMVGAGSGAYVAGGKNYGEIFKCLEAARDRYQPGMKLTAGGTSGESRADHGPFIKAGVHAVSLFGSGGDHHGYHTPEDTAWWVTPKNIQALSRVVLAAALEQADGP